MTSTPCRSDDQGGEGRQGCRRGSDDGFHVGYGQWVTHAEWTAFTSALGFGDDRSEPAATPAEMLEVIEQAFADAHDHYECPVWCDECDRWEQPRSCTHCEGSGYGGPRRTYSIDEPIPGWTDCDWCAGDGREHQSEPTSPVPPQRAGGDDTNERMESQ